MTIYRKTGLVIIILGIVMFFFAVYMFSLTGKVNPIISKIGMYSFIFWLQTIVLGIIVALISKRKIV